LRFLKRKEKKRKEKDKMERLMRNKAFYFLEQITSKLSMVNID
jgi:hypothetical protein